MAEIFLFLATPALFVTLPSPKMVWHQIFHLKKPLFISVLRQATVKEKLA